MQPQDKATETKDGVVRVYHHKAMGHLAREPIADIVKFSVGRMVRLRIPWLFVGLLGGVFSTSIVEFFESSLHEKLVLAFFIPLIVYMADAVGTQTETLFVRALSIEKVELKKFLLKEIFVGLIIGLTFSAAMALYTRFVFNDPTLALIVGISMLMTILAAVIVATTVPWAIRKFGGDPAIGAGPFTTIAQDLISLSVYFLVAALILS